MRWPFGPPHLTLKPSQKNTKRKHKKEKKYQKRASQSSVNFFFSFWWVSKISLFWQLGQKSAHPKNTIKIGVSENNFLKSSSESRNRHFWPNPEIPVIIFFLFSSLSTKNTEISWNPYFYSVLANPPKEKFENLNLKNRKLKNPIFAPFFWKGLFLENCQIIGHKKHTQW